MSTTGWRAQDGVGVLRTVGCAGRGGRSQHGVGVLKPGRRGDNAEDMVLRTGWRRSGRVGSAQDGVGVIRTELEVLSTGLWRLVSLSAVRHTPSSAPPTQSTWLVYRVAWLRYAQP